MRALILLNLITLIFFFTLSATANTKAEVEQLKKQIEELKLAKQKEQEKKSLAEKADLLRKELLELKKNQKVDDKQLEERKVGSKSLIFYKGSGKKLFTGVRVRKYNSGSLLSEAYFEDGLRAGNQTVYYENGSKKIESKWKNGLKKVKKPFITKKGGKLARHTILKMRNMVLRSFIKLVS